MHPDLAQEIKGELFGIWKPSWKEMRDAVSWSKSNYRHIGDYPSVRSGACNYLKGLYRLHLEAQVARLREALGAIVSWSEAYPLDIFPEPDFEKAHKLLQAGGMTLDAISASNMRRVVEGVGRIAQEALDA